MKSMRILCIIFCLIGIMFSINFVPSFALNSEPEPEPPQIPEPEPEPIPMPISKPPPPPEPFPGETESEKIERLILENEKLKKENNITLQFSK